MCGDGQVNFVIRILNVLIHKLTPGPFNIFVRVMNVVFFSERM